MKKLISAFTLIVLSAASLSTAAPGQGAMGRAAEQARERAERERPHKGPKHGPKAIRRDARWHRRDVRGNEQALRRLRADLRSAERARDWRRAQRDRAAISRLEYQIRADREYNRRYEGNARYSSRNDNWWTRHLGRTGG